MGSLSRAEVKSREASRLSILSEIFKFILKKAKNKHTNIVS